MSVLFNVVWTIPLNTPTDTYVCASTEQQVAHLFPKSFFGKCESHPRESDRTTVFDVVSFKLFVCFGSFLIFPIHPLPREDSHNYCTRRNSQGRKWLSAKNNDDKLRWTTLLNPLNSTDKAKKKKGQRSWSPRLMRRRGWYFITLPRDWETIYLTQVYWRAL